MSLPLVLIVLLLSGGAWSDDGATSPVSLANFSDLVIVGPRIDRTTTDKSTSADGDPRAGPHLSIRDTNSPENVESDRSLTRIWSPTEAVHLDFEIPGGASPDLIVVDGMGQVTTRRTHRHLDPAYGLALHF